jgi:hypothetical protein
LELEVASAFPTLIGRYRMPVADAMNEDLQALILVEDAKYASLGPAAMSRLALAT